MKGLNKRQVGDWEAVMSDLSEAQETWWTALERLKADLRAVLARHTETLSEHSGNVKAAHGRLVEMAEEIAQQATEWLEREYAPESA